MRDVWGFVEDERHSLVADSASKSREHTMILKGKDEEEGRVGVKQVRRICQHPMRLCQYVERRTDLGG